MSSEYKNLLVQILLTKIDKTEVVRRQKYEQAAKFRDTEKQLINELCLKYSLEKPAYLGEVEFISNLISNSLGISVDIIKDMITCGRRDKFYLILRDSKIDDIING